MERHAQTVKRYPRFRQEAKLQADKGGWSIYHSDRIILTSARTPLTVPHKPLAEAIRAEWNVQDSTLDPAAGPATYPATYPAAGSAASPVAKPMTALANAAIDQVAHDHSRFAATIVAYAETDLLCYRECSDTVLAAEQAAAWDPLLAWAQAKYGIAFALAEGVMYTAQPSATVSRLESAVLALDSFRLAGLSPLVAIGGSLIAGLAIVEGVHHSDHLWPILMLDELYQERRWGGDPQAQAARNLRRSDWNNAARFLRLLRGEVGA